MSIYNFAPISPFSINHPFLTWVDAFTEEQLNQIVEYCDKQEKFKATIDSNEKEDYDDIRKSTVSWIKNNEEIPFLYDTMAYVARQLNSKFYNFNLSGFVEDMQYTIYNGESEDHYTWHIDAGTSNIPRKLSMILQLSDPSEYEGGFIETMTSANPSCVDRKKGLITAFPSWVLHRVSPVTSGSRKSLVVWIAGPQFV